MSWTRQPLSGALQTKGRVPEPAHGLWRLCAACAWATTDAAAEIGQCPRCGSKAVADQGSLLTVLPMRVVSSTEREITARVGDDSEDRDREFHEVVITVDIEPEDITSALLHTNPDTVFGVEAARAARIRYLNLGLHESFEAIERIASFKAALLLGLRDSFGGDPSHLRVLQSDFPAPGGDGDLRNRFVVVHDMVPGGTGYLHRLSDAERLRTILQRAVELIATCYRARHKGKLPISGRGRKGGFRWL